MTNLQKYLGLSVVLIAGLFLTTLAGKTSAQATCTQLVNDKGQAKYTVAVPENGTYTLWLRMLADKTDGVEVQVDDLCPTLPGALQQTESGFGWASLVGTDKQSFKIDLTAGNHTIVVAGRQVGAGVDRLQLVKGVDCQPAGFGDNCLDTASGQESADDEPSQSTSAAGVQSGGNAWAVVAGVAIIMGASTFLAWTYYRFHRKVYPSLTHLSATAGSIAGGHSKRLSRLVTKLRAFVLHHKVIVSVCTVAIVAGATMCVVFAQSSSVAEGEAGTLGGGAKIVDDAHASGGKYVLFENNPAGSAPPNLAAPAKKSGGASAAANGGGSSSGSENNGGGSGGDSGGGGGSVSSFPNASNTGWEHTGVTLQPCSLPLVDSTYDSCLFTGEVNVSDANITITRSKIVGTVNYRFSDGGSLRNLTLIDVEIDSSTSLGGATIGNNDYTCIRCHIHGGTRGANVGFNVTIKDSYLHGWYASPGDHITGIGSNGGANNVIDHNNISCDITNDPSGYACSSALSVYGDDPPGNDNWTITNNLLNSGSSYCMIIAGPPSKPYPYTNVTVTGNTFGNVGAQYWNKPDAQCTEFGAISGWTGGATNTWSNNKDINGSPINPT